MGATPVTLDMSTLQPLPSGGGVTLDMSTAKPIGSPNAGLAPAAGGPRSQPQPSMGDPTAGLPGGSVNPQPATPGMTKAAEIGIGAAGLGVGGPEAWPYLAKYGPKAVKAAETAGRIGLGAYTLKQLLNLADSK